MLHYIVLSFLIFGSIDSGYVPSNEQNANEIGFLKTELAKLRKEVQEVQRQNERCERIRTGKNEVDGNKKRLLDNTDDLHTIQVDVQNLKSAVVSLQSLKSNVSNLQNQVLSIKHLRIGFTAVLSQDVSNLGDNQVIVFDKVYSNLGNNYNPLTGVFTCEVPGLYAFYVHTLAEPGKHLETSISKNLKIVAQTYAYDKEYFSSGSNMAVVYLEKGDTMLVRSLGKEHDHDGAVIDFYYTSFSGFLVN